MISLEWVKDYIDIEDEDLKELAVKITKAGINVEKVITNHIDNLVIGEVLECTNHPGSDHLNVCKVNVGESTLQIVCGAPNVRKNLKVIVALPGATLPGDFTIKKGVIRGVESNGMICALFELGLEEKTEENYNKGIHELDSEAPVGIDPLKYMGIDDTVYELDVHKHRNNDCYYHIGFAYEIAAILNKTVKLPELDIKPIKDDIKNYFSLDVKTDKCPFYLAKMAKDVKIKESPEFIKKRLISAGMRPINNVVDISNYVMLEFGQPLHFFDKEKLGQKIVVRDACNDEVITTLDDKERILKSSDIVITDGKKPVCIAGVMGGKNTLVDEKTNTLLIESAIFDATSIRYTSSRLNLKSEASIRYGKGLNYEYTRLAIERACHLLEKYADANILSGTIEYDKIDKTIKKVEFTEDDINSMLGIKISKKDIEIELKKLGFDYEIKGNYFIATIPNRRLDIEPNINDIAEEIGRLYGYHNLVSTLPVASIKKGEYVGDVKYRKLVSKRLRMLGLNETKTYTLISPDMSKLFKYEKVENLNLPNPMSIDKSVIRTSLLPSLLNVYEYNKARKVKDIMLYEISKTYDKDYKEDLKVSILMKGDYITNTWQKSKVEVDFYLIKGIVENILDYLGLSNRYSFEKSIVPEVHPGIGAYILVDREQVGIIGKIHPIINKDDIYVAELSLKKLIRNIKPIKYKQASRYPIVQKDLAFIVDKNMEAMTLIAQIKKSAGKLLTDINVFDVYCSDSLKDKKSIAFTLTFSDPTSTLNDVLVTELFNKIINEVEIKCNAKLRDN
ncbi:MAG: phenylalanine--tRNA ligase subunit beta [Clostridium sp.]|nr:phenylalanine--tRNA ligase subunit beta [Clostridium sp.]MCM1444460.1 phenylalanine--tRNA ligase subunit beta [Candidatus Amulumruptor caecigallinarius]